MGEIADIVSGHVRYSPHGETELKPYPKTFRDHVADLILSGNPSNAAVNFTAGLMGSTGISHSAPAVVDFVPYLGNAFGMQENLQNGNYKGAGLNFLGLTPALGGLRKMITGAPASAAVTPANKAISGAATGIDQYLIQNEPELDDEGY